MLTVIEGVNTVDQIPSLFYSVDSEACHSNAIRTSINFLKFMYMLQSKGSYPKHIIGETSISHWEASVKANVASWFIMIMCHVHRKKS